MSLNPATSGHICPNCGAPNSALSIFCAECGTGLNTNRDDDDRENAGQTTLTFTPVSDEPDPAVATWESARDTQATQEFTPQAQDAPGADEYTASGWQPQDTYGAPVIERARESRRGFVLGLIAAFLIAIVIGFFVWSSVVSQGFRDSVTGLF
jgi:hypothetical protein